MINLLMTQALPEIYNIPSEKEYKSTIINMIEKDTQDKLIDVNNEEIRHIVNNIYIFCKLKAIGADNEKICQTLLVRNNEFYDYMVQNGLNYSHLESINIDFYKKMVKKYTKVIKGLIN